MPAWLIRQQSKWGYVEDGSVLLLWLLNVDSLISGEGLGGDMESGTLERRGNTNVRGYYTD